jgi:hypothetical protein
MFDKIGRFAETLASSAGQSRRGFLALTGTAAVSLASVVGGCLLFPGEAVAQRAKCTGAYRYQCPDGSLISGGCTQICGCEATRRFRGMTCNLARSTCARASAPQGSLPQRRGTRRR